MSHDCAWPWQSKHSVIWRCLCHSLTERVWMWHKESQSGDCTDVSVIQQICTRLNWSCLWGARYSVPRNGWRSASRDRKQCGILDLPHPHSSVELSSFQGFLWLYGFVTLPAAVLYFSFLLNSSLKAGKGIPCSWVLIVVEWWFSSLTSWNEAKMWLEGKKTQNNKQKGSGDRKAQLLQALDL